MIGVRACNFCTIFLVEYRKGGWGARRRWQECQTLVTPIRDGRCDLSQLQVESRDSGWTAAGTGESEKRRPCNPKHARKRLAAPQRARQARSIDDGHDNDRTGNRQSAPLRWRQRGSPDARGSEFGQQGRDHGRLTSEYACVYICACGMAGCAGIGNETRRKRSNEEG